MAGCPRFRHFRGVRSPPAILKRPLRGFGLINLCGWVSDWDVCENCVELIYFSRLVTMRAVRKVPSD